MMEQSISAQQSRENAGDQVVIGFSFESDWLRESYIVKHKQSDDGYFRHLQGKCLYDTIFCQ